MVNNENFPTHCHDVSDGVCEELGVHDVDYAEHTDDESYENEDKDELDEDPDDRDFWVDEYYVQNVEEDLKQFEKIVVDERQYEHHVEFGEESSDYEGSDELGSVESSSSDDETQVRRRKRKTPKFDTYRRQTDLRHPRIKLGLEFPNMNECREAIREFSICSGKRLTFEKNFPHRVKVQCLGVGATKCPFELCAGFVGKKGPTVRVKKFIPEHSCGRVTNNRFASSTWLASRFDQDLRLNPKMKVGDFITTVKEKYGIIVTKDQVYKAKQKAGKSIQGSIEEQYGLLRDYGEELMRVNPGTTVKFKTELMNEEPVFLRMYICYGALKRGFLEGCRTVVGLDGCHIKGPHKGQLLSAVGIDANNGMFPITFAVAELENRDSWTWFLEIFIADMGIQDGGAGWVFISDKQKGLEAAIKDLVPNAEHRHCVRHFYNNFKGDGHGGLALKQTVWGAAKATTIPWFEEEMDLLLKQSKPAWDWFQKPGRSPNHWSRSHFTTHPKCDILLNNLCEAFNSAIIPARDQPVLTMFERLRIYLMLRMAKQREKRWTQEVGPRIFNIVEKNKKDSDSCMVEVSIRGHYEVTHLYGRKFYVDLEKHTCSCRKWDLCGIPCSHAMASICWMQRNPLDYVHSLYKRAAYDRAYAHFICPMSSQDLWPKTGQRAIRPPKYHKQVGRPKKSRNRESGEIRKGATKLPRYDVIIVCRSCGVEGHNRKTCPLNLVEQVQADLPSHTPTQASTSTEANTPIQADVTSRSQTHGMRGGRAGSTGVRGGRAGSTRVRGGRASRGGARGGGAGRGGAGGGGAGREGALNQQEIHVPLAPANREVNRGGHVRQVPRQHTASISTQATENWQRQASGQSASTSAPHSSVGTSSGPWRP